MIIFNLIGILMLVFLPQANALCNKRTNLKDLTKVVEAVKVKQQVIVLGGLK